MVQVVELYIGQLNLHPYWEYSMKTGSLIGEREEKKKKENELKWKYMEGFGSILNP